MKKLVLALTLTAGITALAGSAKAQNNLLNGVNSVQSFGTGDTIGYTFQVGGNNLLAYILGNSGGMGVGGYSIGLWDASGNLLASTTAYLSSSFQNYVWNSIAPTTLQAGQQYTIGSVGYPWGTSQNANVGTAAGLSPYVSIVGAGVGGNGGYTGPNVYNLTDPINRLPYGISGIGNVIVGPNLQFSLAPFVYSQSGTTTISSTLSGPVAVGQIGSGTTILTAQNSYTGGTVVSAGTLVASGPNSGVSALGTGNVTVNSGGTLLVGSDNALGWNNGATTTINTGGVLSITATNAQNLNAVTLAGGTIDSPSNLGATPIAWGSFIFQGTINAGGVPSTSVMNALDMALIETGGTIFNVSSGSTNGIDLLVSGSFSTPINAGSTGLIKTGTGTMQFSGTNTYTGDTTLDGGRTIVTGSIQNGTNFYVGNANSGVVLQISNTGVVSDVYGIVGNSIASSNNSVLVTGSGSAWSNSWDNEVGASSANNSMVISNGGTVFAGGGAYIGSSSWASNNTVLVTGSDSSWQIANTGNAGGFYVGLYGSSNSLVISNGGSVSDGIAYISEFAGSSNNSVVITGVGSTLSNGGSSYIYEGSAYVGYRGSGTLTVANKGAITATDLSLGYYSGSSGTLNVGSLGGNDLAGNLNTPSIAFGSGSGTINFNQSDTAHITSSISGNGFINQLGSGSTVLSASNSFSGPTVVNAGSLVISSTGTLSGSGTVTVNAGATLQNNGIIAGATIVGGTLAGNGGSFSSLKLNSSSSLLWNVGSFIGTAGTAWDLLNAQSLDLTSVSSSNPITINIQGVSGLGNGSATYSFNFMNVAGSMSGFIPGDFSINSSSFNADPSLAGGVWSINSSVVGGVTQLQAVYAVPEPSTYALFGLGLVSLLAVRRKPLC